MLGLVANWAMDPLVSVQKYLPALLAQQGDPVACAVIAEAGRMVGRAVTNLIHLVNPEMVILGGSLAMAGDLCFGRFRMRSIDFVDGTLSRAPESRWASLANAALSLARRG